MYKYKFRVRFSVKVMKINKHTLSESSHKEVVQTFPQNFVGCVFFPTVAQLAYNGVLFSEVLDLSPSHASHPHIYCIYTGVPVPLLTTQPPGSHSLLHHLLISQVFCVYNSIWFDMLGISVHPTLWENVWYDLAQYTNWNEFSSIPTNLVVLDGLGIK